MALTTQNPDFMVTPIVDAEYLTNVVRYNGRRIGTAIYRIMSFPMILSDP